jgi:predicted phage terminase large subunit-like protein
VDRVSKAFSGLGFFSSSSSSIANSTAGGAAAAAATADQQYKSLRNELQILRNSYDENGNRAANYKAEVERLTRAKIEAKQLRIDFEAFVKAAWADNNPVNGNLRAVYVEDKSSGTGLIQEMKGRLPIQITAVQRNVDKYTRAMDCQPHQGRVKLRQGDPSNYDFVTEVCSFQADDSHEHDDQTDTMMDAIDKVIIAPAVRPKAFILGGR